MPGSSAPSSPPARQPGSPVANRLTTGLGVTLGRNERYPSQVRAVWWIPPGGLRVAMEHKRMLLEGEEARPMSTQTTLRGRDAECSALDRLIDAVRGGESRAIVLRGEAGVGKSALLEYVVESASGCRVARAAGVEYEMELAYAGVHQLCAPMLDLRDRLPGPQRDALATAFGMNAGPAPDRFVVALAALGLLAEVGEEQPLICVVDDAQWLDKASVLSLAFVARRLMAESVGLIFAVRDPSGVQELTGLEEMLVGGLGEDDARALLDSTLPGRLDERIRERIIAETHGNPLALLELPRGLTPAELAGGFALPDARPLTDRIERSFLRRLEHLPVETRRLLLTAAAEPFGDVGLLWRAADELGLGPDAAAPAEAAGLVQLGALVRFRHPLVRSAVYQAASLQERREAHRALAESIDADVDPDRRAWHRAQAAPGPDEDVAEELERSADRAQARGGVAAAAAFLERAAALTPDPARRADRALDAAQAKLIAGAFEPAAALVAMAEAGPPDELRLARIDLLHAQIAFVQNRGNEATPLMLAAARRLERLDVPLARGTYLDAFAAAIFAGRLAAGPGLREVGAAARGAPPPPQLPRLPDGLLDALAVRLTDGYSASSARMKRVLGELCEEEIPVQEALRWLWLGSVIAADLWDEERWNVVATRHVTITRETGALSELPGALDSRAFVHLLAGELAAAAALVEEVTTVCAAIGSNPARLGPLGLAAFRGREREARSLIDATMSDAAPRGQGAGVTVAHWLHALLCNGLSQYEDALAAAHEAARPQEEFGAPRWGLVELVEAAARSGASEMATDALERLSETAQASGTNWALGVEARSRALLSEGDAAEKLYREAIERLAHTRVRVELARAHLLFGEWLRRQNRRVDGREQLRTAYDAFSRMGTEAFADRARRELLATGETVRRRIDETRDVLTAQEAQIAVLARDGFSNPDIGTRLFISPRTVQYHLHKVFLKLDINSRNQLGRVPPSRLVVA
jgi:DNA-binding CsgD family transcriptional regulator/tetratricopeptide (TPR) repeat protein